MANPDPEITPEDVKAVRPDAIVATGRSDYPNQVNNVLGFPYIFRGALDVRARTINEEMKIAAAEALAELAREDVPDEVALAYRGARPVYGPDYIIPGAVRSALDQPRVGRGGRSGDQNRRGAARIEGCRHLSLPAFGAARSLRRAVPAHHGQRARQSQARGVCGRRRGIRDPRGGGVPEFRSWQGDAGGPRGDHQNGHCARRASKTPIWKSACRIRRRTPRPISRRCSSACSGAARSIAIACAW